MHAAISKLREDLTELSDERLHHFDECKTAEQLACRVIQECGSELLQDVLDSVANWWDDEHPIASHATSASMHTRLALIEWIRAFSRGGS